MIVTASLVATSGNLDSSHLTLRLEPCIPLFLSFRTLVSAFGTPSFALFDHLEHRPILRFCRPFHRDVMFDHVISPAGSRNVSDRCHGE